ncbi:MAG: hypothetical protein GWN00_03245 [Aliifodinibius sp.]|nr:hypothetical protein [Fodinibius sp.]NIY23861.1 hypothetical protein [Fodinibius sp.]
MGSEILFIINSCHFFQRKPAVAGLALMADNRHILLLQKGKYSVKPGIVDHNLPAMLIEKSHSDVFPDLYSYRSV